MMLLRWCTFDLGDGVVPGRSLFDVSNSLFYAKPRLAVLEAAIKKVVRHCQDEYYGHSIYSPTGPLFWVLQLQVRKV